MSTDERLQRDEGQSRDQKSAFAGLHSAITERILAVYFDVYNELGGGFLESVYQNALRIALLQAGLQVTHEVAVPVYFRGELVGSFRADLIVNACVLLELKAVSVLDKEHEGQILHYLRATNLEVGLLLNFGPKPQFKRFVLENENKKIRVGPRSSAVVSLGDLA